MSVLTCPVPFVLYHPLYCIPDQRVHNVSHFRFCTPYHPLLIRKKRCKMHVHRICTSLAPKQSGVSCQHYGWVMHDISDSWNTVATHTSRKEVSRSLVFLEPSLESNSSQRLEQNCLLGLNRNRNRIPIRLDHLVKHFNPVLTPEWLVSVEEERSTKDLPRDCLFIQAVLLSQHVLV